ncbi:helix-turn-helix domain-containing protein [Alkalibacillus salilacus]|uniref:Zn-dependent peptidase ImmA (M78 family)/DNA-binding XRE family transcriptional regulator n=1 Tax=Alkalibacillus salilacus TaxID=284582 RepID=A0ABT9VII8_9BACI|nr:XRE family transcriptional regulator [Alkalibacillus salilacus]MDQ0160729.1 Zn-dependent peptidase ImmA (M78 family)/DNA-binding XRE family transcriptional regulator [Alkalibacillus salilacus]
MVRVKDENFNAKRLKEARLTRGLTISELAMEIDVSRQAISQFELGESVPKQETIMNIINTLNFPKSFFFKEYNEQFVGNTFFRANATATKKNKERQYTKTLLAGYIYDYLSEYVELPKLNLPDVSEFNGDWSDEEIEDLALRLREFWEIGNKPISNVVHLFEKNGIMIFSVDTDSLKVDAFAQHRKGKPFIFLGNDKDSSFRRQFDAAHELGHILMHKTVDNQEVLSKSEFKRMEEQANKFASAFLLPSEAFIKTVTSDSLLHFIELKKYWYVSMAAMIYRSYDIGLIDESRYTSLQKQISMKKMRKKEPLDDVFPVQHPVVLNKSIHMLLENNVKNELEIIQEIGVPQDQIEMLCHLEQGTLNLSEAEPELNLFEK